MIGEPYIPETVTVHLGTPGSNAQNITVDFPSYIKNVASSEIYPTWPESALRANIYAIISFTLNRIYTEWYRLKGYDFDITNTTQYDQSYVYGRDIFDNIDRIVDEIFNSYVVRQGNVEPLFTSFCNGTTVTCNGLSQWGTVTLAEQGLTPYEILQNYYGNDIDIKTNVPVSTNTPSFPQLDLEIGSGGNDVKTIQVQLNRISQNYPLIPKISDVDGVFGVATENAVKTFQQIFNLPQTGIVNEATWYKIAYIYVSVKKLAELNSEGISVEEAALPLPSSLALGAEGEPVRNVQYYLAVIGAYYESVMPVDITGFYGEETENSVKSFQKTFGLEQTGTIDRETWNELYKAYAGIVESVPLVNDDVVLYPGTILKAGITDEYVRILQEWLSLISKSYPNIPDVSATGYFGPQTKASVTEFQRQFSLRPSGIVAADTWNSIASIWSDLKYGYDKKPYQNPGYTIAAI